MPRVGPVERVTLWVRDVEASLAFYRDQLGLEVIEDKVLEGPPVRALLGAPIDDVKPSATGAAPAGGYREAIFFDPHGIPVSLIQFEPA